jgi:hypothetical protein
MDEQMLFKNPGVFPTEAILAEALGTHYLVYKALMNRMEQPDLDIHPEWRYYNDGKAWLCKMTFRKKTIFWLSAWNVGLKMAFYFTEKHMEAFSQLPVREEWKDQLASAKPFGKLCPLALTLTNNDLLDDVFCVAAFKKQLK